MPTGQAEMPAPLLYQSNVIVIGLSHEEGKIVFGAALPPQKHPEASQASPRADQAQIVPRNLRAMSASISIANRIRNNDHRITKSIESSIDFVAKRQVWQRMILKIIRAMFIAMNIWRRSKAAALSRKAARRNASRRFAII